MYRLLKTKNRGLSRAVNRFAQDLVRTPSVSLNEGGVADRVEQEMQKLNYDNVFRDETGNVVGLIEGRAAEPAVLLCTHMDTVPTGDRAAWSEDPYSGRIDGRWLHGRGAADCKGGLAAQVYSGALLKRSLLPLQGTVIVAATVYTRHWSKE